MCYNYTWWSESRRVQVERNVEEPKRHCMFASHEYRWSLCDDDEYDRSGISSAVRCSVNPLFCLKSPNPYLVGWSQSLLDDMPLEIRFVFILLCLGYDMPSLSWGHRPEMLRPRQHTVRETAPRCGVVSLRLASFLDNQLMSIVVPFHRLRRSWTW
jgi:hypothetical protein